MTQLLKLTSKIILVTLSSAYLMSCTGGNVSSSFGTSTTSASEGPAGSSDGIAEPEQFYVGVDNTINDIAHVHENGAFDKNCAIDATSTLVDKKCIIDSPEAEIYMHGLALKYNVPAGMCRFLARDTYWFYNHEIGYGPTAIEIHLTVTDGVVTFSECRFNGMGAFGSCNSNIEATVDTSTSSPKIKCIYDHSDTEYGKNGCFGSYVYSLTTTTVSTAAGTSTVSSSVSTISWGGQMTPILGGAVRQGWPADKDGNPATIITPAHLGLFKESYTLPPAIQTSGMSPWGLTAMEIANYAIPALNTHTGYVAVATQSSLPYAIAPIDDFDGSRIRQGQDSYSFECLDQGHEILNRVRVYVREWDTYQDYYDYITSKGTTENPDRGLGMEGLNCTGLGGYCNDYADFDDIANAFVSYTTIVPVNNTTDINLRRRRDYFPQIISR